MKLPIEIWLTEACVPEEARVAFDEAVLCFKAGACRAALLLSYVGWGLCIRYRVLTARCPRGIPPAKWNSIADQLRSEDKWDAQAFGCTQMKSPAPIFDVSDDLRTQVKFWKDRRNDCAHFKLNEIGSSYVEAFWSFIQSNMGRFVPSGSEEDLLDRIERHFDPNFTPPGTSIEPVVGMISSAVEPTRLPQFLQSVVARLSIGSGDHAFPRINELTVFFDEALSYDDNSLISATVNLLSDTPQLLVALVRRCPSGVLNWAASPTIIRRLWRELLFEHGHRDLPVFAALLRNDLIPPEQVAEANVWVIGRLQGDIPGETDSPALARAGFFEAFKQHAFAQKQIDRFDWGNRNAGAIRWFVEQFPIDDTTALAICSTFNSPPYPFDVQDSLRRLFAEDSQKGEEFVTAARQAGSVPPSAIVVQESDRSA